MRLRHWVNDSPPGILLGGDKAALTAQSSESFDGIPCLRSVVRGYALRDSLLHAGNVEVTSINIVT